MFARLARESRRQRDFTRTSWPAIAGLALASFGVVLAANAAPTALKICLPTVSHVSNGYAGHHVEIPIVVTGSAELHAFGFDIVTDGDEVALTRMRRGPITRNWLVLDALPTLLNIRIGGYDPEGFSLSGTDTLVVLEFTTLKPVVAVPMYLGNLVDDFAGATRCQGGIEFTRALDPPNGYISVLPQGVVNCCYATPDGAQLQVVAHPEGWVDSGIFAAAFRVEFSPPAPGATLTWTPAPATLGSLGNPIDNTSAPDDTSGALVYFLTCQRPIRGEVPLGTITVHGLSAPGQIFVKRHNKPFAGYRPCANFLRCDNRYLACMTSLAEDDPYIFRAQINQPSCNEDCGYVAVRPVTWGTVKALYR
jgi:hypothetical protein